VRQCGAGSDLVAQGLLGERIEAGMRDGWALWTLKLWF
jgi:hypothetical protein